MLKFTLNKEHLRTELIFYFHLKKTAPESYQLLKEAYGDHAPSQDMCVQCLDISKVVILMLQTMLCLVTEGHGLF
jgi:hypothetical protein